MTRCIEKKTTLFGNTLLFECELLYLNKGVGVLKYVIDREYRLRDTTLVPGDVTYAFYWTHAPYTLYRWRLDGGKIIYYFNVADSVSLQPQEFFWRDLVIDISVDSDLNAHVLDENELRADLSPELLAYIRSATNEIMQNYRVIISEVNGLLHILNAET